MRTASSCGSRLMAASQPRLPHRRQGRRARRKHRRARWQPAASHPCRHGGRFPRAGPDKRRPCETRQQCIRMERLFAKPPEVRPQIDRPLGPACCLQALVSRSFQGLSSSSSPASVRIRRAWDGHCRVNQDPARDHAHRPFQNAHAAVSHQQPMPASRIRLSTKEMRTGSLVRIRSCMDSPLKPLVCSECISYQASPASNRSLRQGSALNNVASKIANRSPSRGRSHFTGRWKTP
jgi:hypothetical protein